VSTDDAALPGPTTPELHASAAPGLDTTLTGVRFEYGASAAYGSGVDAVTADARWSALAPGFPVGTLLHYRAVATVTGNGQTRSVAGADRTVLLLSPPPPVPLPVPTPKPLPKLAAATVIKLTAPSRTCSSRRTLTLRFAAPKGTKIVKAKITLRGKSTTYTGKRLKPRIDLRGLPKGTFKVKVSVTLADGRAATLSKTYKTCSVRRRASGR
jgi:hypothetical protein